MKSQLPILTSIRSDWNEISEAPVLGKDVLELLSSSMYVNPLSVFREYIQNATDSIEEAVGIGHLRNAAEGKIEVHIDTQARRVRIRDNGTGIPHVEFVKRLIALGASRKRGRKARGFRGVGRLSGLGYCQELVFRSRVEGERQISELRWDCKKLKAILRDAQFSDQLGDVVGQVVRTKRTVNLEAPERFFEVELVGMVRHGSDLLMNASVVSAYLSQIAPVPFSPLFEHKASIEQALSQFVSLGNVLIFVNGATDPLYRPHRNTFVARKGLTDDLATVEIFELLGSNGAVAAVGWVCHHGYLGAISKEAQIAGLRLRCGNIQVGEDDLLNGLFQEPRFNAWSVGEIHVLDERILPNGRRDHFEPNVHFNDLLNQLTPRAHELGRLCRLSSIERNATREYETTKALLENKLSIAIQGAVSKTVRRKLETEVRSAFTHLSRMAAGRLRESPIQPALSEQIGHLEKEIAKVFHRSNETSKVPGRSAKERKLYEHIFELIYECSTDGASTKALIDRVLARLE